MSATFFKKHFWLILLIFLAFSSRFLFLWHPAEVVFDEVHFGKFVSYYFSGEYFFDIHPPLGKLLIAGFANLWGFGGGFDFAAIGESYGAGNFFILRFLPAFAGALLVVFVHKLTLAISGFKRAALIAGFLVLLDNAFLVEARFILVDSLLFFFIILALWLFVLSQKRKVFSRRWFFLFGGAGLAAGASLSIKWTGLAPLGLIMSLAFLEIFRRKSFFSSLENPPKIAGRALRFFAKSVVLILAAGLVYTAGFYVHFALLGKSGPGDAFMSSAFQKTLENSDYQNDDLPVPGFWQKFTELNKTMYAANAGLSATHSFSSRWHDWPLGRRSIYYWAQTDDNSGARSDIWLVGNPLAWFLAAVTVILTLLAIFSKSRRRKFGEISFFLIFAYFANLLPFIFVSRVAFLYHYLPALIFAFILLAIKIDGILKQKKSLAVFFGLLTLFFLILAPVSYGFSAPDKIIGASRSIVAFLSKSF